MTISASTKRNWEKLNVTAGGDRLTKRANKTRSRKNILPGEYFSDAGNIPVVVQLIDDIKSGGICIRDAVFSIILNRFGFLGIMDKTNVGRFLSEYSGCTPARWIIELDLPANEADLPGLVYQSLYTEGAKNKQGLYYTPAKLAKRLCGELDFSREQRMLDPCCGSGSFLLNTRVKNPRQLFGIDRDPIAVMLCKANLIMKFGDEDFDPQVLCCDFLAQPVSSEKFDYISTNPPWGAAAPPGTLKEESFELFLYRALENLNEKGTLTFLLPEAALNVKAYRKLRSHILEHYTIGKIELFPSVFTSVSSKAAALTVTCGKGSRGAVIIESGRVYTVDTEVYKGSPNRVYMLADCTDREILCSVESRGKHNLSQSIWALGIVTGNNAKMLSDSPAGGGEPIYTGKEIRPYKLLAPKKYINYDPVLLQQAARDEIYRADEKLVYKFISGKLVFAYDGSSSLFLNSANILIPKIQDMGILSALLFLNSELFGFVYQKKFGEVKILKGNLCELRFPELSGEEDMHFGAVAAGVISGKYDESTAQKAVYDYYCLTEKQIRHIKKSLGVL